MFYKETDESYLEHHGIKGQKWGVIRTPEQLGHYKINKNRPTLSRKIYDTRTELDPKTNTYKTRVIKRDATDDEQRERMALEAAVQANQLRYDRNTKLIQRNKNPFYRLLNMSLGLDELYELKASKDADKLYDMLADPKNWTFEDYELPDFTDIEMKDLHEFIDFERLYQEDEAYNQARLKELHKEDADDHVYLDKELR